MIGLQISPRPAPEVSPQLIAANTILQLSTLELEQAITRELDENPALEMVEQSRCHICGNRSGSDFCYHCNTRERIEPGPLASNNNLDEARSEEIDPLSFIQAPLTLGEQLFSQLRLLLDRRDHHIALYMVESLDEHGYLTLSVAELAQLLHVETGRIKTVVKALQSLDPAGIGAYNLTECLLLQLDRLIEKGIKPPAPTRILIERYLKELGHHQFESIRVALCVPRSEVEESLIFIRTNLHPYPAHHYFAPRDNKLTGTNVPVPSVAIHHSLDGYDVEVIESQRSLLRLNPLYQHIRQEPASTLQPAEREHVAQYVERTRLFMSQIQRRTLFLQKVMTYIINYQRDFLDCGPSHLRPLSQKMVAQALGVHVSMISRAIANKYAQLPGQEIIPLHRFFSGEFRTQELIRRLIAEETDPLSDAHIARLLNEHHAISLTRQMVANYRSDLRIPAARQRGVLRRIQGKSDERQRLTPAHPAYR